MEKENKKTIEIPFGAKDSELYKFEYAIPDGMEAIIDGNKVIIRKKEGEDERIRKSLVEYFRKFKPKDMWDEMFSFGDVLSYLERQKDKREIDFAEGKVEGVKQTCQEIKDAMYLFEPKDLTPFELTFRDYIDSAIRYCLSGEGYQQYIKEWAADLLNIEKKKEQKPAEWSEEDEKMLDAIIHDVMTLHNAKNLEELKNKVSWLKSLRPQPKQEWSQEDNEFADDAIACVTRCYKRYIDNKDFYQSLRHNTLDIKRWLLNVRKRLSPHWKPSEEQMKDLDLASRMNGLTCPNLKSLYNDLQKLM